MREALELIRDFPESVPGALQAIKAMARVTLSGQPAAQQDAPTDDMRVLYIAGTICQHLDTALDQSRVMAAARDIARYAPAQDAERERQQGGGDAEPDYADLLRQAAEYTRHPDYDWHLDFARQVTAALAARAQRAEGDA
ncbi:hypothetical protein BAU06_09150 [Bordetella bronchialis]|uniref:Uncharacterized protein n=2 Tax=Bordetella bronchialis TaxID=463025 RepID=A0ABN4QZJ1_9BORD|nr:hypothetical protein BAU06_09150 [Bordetella bronchialis]